MKKHHVLKAFVLLVVIFFHSFVLVPKANATAFEGILGRLAFRAMAPSVIAALGSGTALVIGAVVAGGIGYLIYKSGAVDALQSWLSSGNPQYPIPPVGTPYITPVFPNGYSVKIVAHDPALNPQSYAIYWSNNGGSVWHFYSGTTNYQDCINYIISTSGGVGISLPSVPQDYVQNMVSSQPSFPSGSMFGTPGVAAAIVGGAAIVSAVTVSDSDADKFIAGSGASAVASDGTQAANPNNPSPTDNTLTAGDSSIIGLLSSMVNYVSNLVGIKTSVDSVKTGIDNAVIGISQQTAVLDNVGTGINSMKNTMDNVGVAINNQTAVLEDVKTGVNQLDNTLTQPIATPSTISARITALRDIASTKFPFSLASSISVSAVTGSSSYVFTSLPLTPSISIPIDPFAGPLHDFFIWVRGILVWLMWAGTIFAILHKGMAL